MIRESWAQQTECAECSKDSYLTGGLCRDCAEAMGYLEGDEG